MNVFPENYEPWSIALTAFPSKNGLKLTCATRRERCAKNAANCQHLARPEQWLVDTVRPLAAASPETAVGMLIKLLPGSERSIADDIVFTKAEVDGNHFLRDDCEHNEEAAK